MVVLTRFEFVFVMVSMLVIGFSVGELYLDFRKFIRKEKLREIKLKEDISR